MIKLFDTTINIVKNSWVSHYHLTPLIKRIRSTNHIPGPDNTFALFSNPRSGSTWLTSLLHHIPESAVIDEPLWRGFYRTDEVDLAHLDGKLSHLNNLRFNFNQPIPEEADWPEARDFFKKLLEIKTLHPALVNETDLSRLKSANKFIFKFNYACLLMPWLVNTFDMKSILLVRHPCAVVSSQLNHPAFRNVLTTNHFKIPNCRYRIYFSKYENILNHVEKPEEILAATWALNYLNTVSHPFNNKKWLTISYENLLLNTYTVLNDVFKYLNVKTPQTLRDETFEPEYDSASTQLSKWKVNLRKSQIENIMSVIKEFGIDTYDEGLEPDYTKLTPQ